MNIHLLQGKKYKREYFVEKLNNYVKYNTNIFKKVWKGVIRWSVLFQDLDKNWNKRIAIISIDFIKQVINKILGLWNV